MKKILSVIVSTALLLAFVVPTSVPAVTPVADPPFTATCQSVTANAGETVSIEVVLSNNPGFNALVLRPSYNSEVMTLKDPQNGELISDFMPADNYNWINSFSDTYENGLLVTLNFDISDTAPSGEYEVGFTNVQCASVGNGTESVNVTLTVIPATVTVTGKVPQQITTGDLDNDGAVTDADAVYLLMNTFFPEDYPLNQPGDFDGDGQVTDADAVYLLMYTFFPQDYPIVKQQPPKEPTDPGETEPDIFDN